MLNVISVETDFGLVGARQCYTSVDGLPTDLVAFVHYAQRDAGVEIGGYSDGALQSHLPARVPAHEEYCVASQLHKRGDLVVGEPPFPTDGGGLGFDR